MASVALCPRCSHDLLVPNDTDPDAWAQCSACNVLFQVKDAITRDLAELRLVEPVPEPAEADDAAEALHEPARDELLSPHPTPTITISSQKTIGDMASLAGGNDISLFDVTAGDESTPLKLPKRSAPTIVDHEPSSAPTWQEPAAESGPTPTMREEPPAEPDANLASARTIADIANPSLPSQARAGATIELGGDLLDDANTDFELEAPSEPPQSIESMAPWDDSEHIERLLAGDEGQPPDDAPTPVRQAASIAADEAGPTDQPFINAEMFAMPTGPRRRRRPSLVRMLVGIVIAGIIGTGLGSVALLWLMGPGGDILGVARYLPSSILPASFSTVSIPLADETTMVDPDTKPAGFDAPATTGKSMVDEVAAVQADEPAQFEPSRATPLSGGDAPAVAGAPTFTSDALAVALQTAKEAQPGLIRGDLRDGKDVQHAKGYSYSMLCDLADKSTFVETASRPDYVAALQHEADELFRATLADTHARGEVALIIPRWMTYDKRKHGGVFFAGTIVGEVGKGSVVECRIDLGGGQELTILVPKTRAEGLDHAGRPVGVVGSIVDSPALHVTGYEGDATQAVWVGRIIPLE